MNRDMFNQKKFSVSLVDVAPARVQKGLDISDDYDNTRKTKQLNASASSVLGTSVIPNIGNISASY